MAEGSISWALEQFSCSICLDLLKNPVTIPCGHSYCMRCVSCSWDQDEQRGAYRCPQCRKSFKQRPALSKNVVFDEMVQKLRKIMRQVDDSGRCTDRDVECDVCTEIKERAVRSCLACVSSYCENHLKQHENLFKGKGHKMIEATGNHLDKNYETAKTTKMQGHLAEMRKKCMQKIQQREQELQKLKEAVESHERSAQTALEKNERIFTELMSFFERRRSQVTQMIRDQQTAAVSRAEELSERLNQEIEDLRRRDADLQQLSQTRDHIQLLQNCRSISVSGSSESPRITVSSLLSFDDVVKSVDKLRDKLQNFCNEEIEVISGTVKDIQIVVPVKERQEECCKYFRHFTVDLNTVNKNLRLSEGNKAVTDTGTTHQYPEHPDRFHGWKQVLCKEIVRDHSYCEIELTGSYGASVSLSYKSISRKGMGDECRFGYNDQSWRLFCSPSRFSFCHNKKETNLTVLPNCSRIGVYVDHKAGVLSFYGVSDTMTLIHRIQTTFTKPLHLGFGLGMNSKVKLCPLTKHSEIL
ncbi:tripartite motif-containing protein 16-like protein [Triplophysa dalaica]|uniref:tripartite motif-containing protein 16-like protein n=1 Tax=Triplophysa dalaica TaxID=1582913 RepID=UPI0024E00393|nr:tripartite motif-containing protein 16-like protein [Triplophysa dalaica]